MTLAGPLRDFLEPLRLTGSDWDGLLELALIGGSLECVQVILEMSGRRITDIRNARRVAIVYGNQALFEQLYALDPILQRTGGELLSAISAGRVEICRFLLENGALLTRPPITDASPEFSLDGMTPLGLIATKRAEPNDLAIARLLLEHKADLQCVVGDPSFGPCNLMTAAAIHKRVDVMEFLLDAGFPACVADAIPPGPERPTDRSYVAV
jgi:ankyrin repeat protein